MGSFIFDPLTGEPTILSTERAARPHFFKEGESPKEKVCPFCKGNEHLTPPTIYEDQEDWNVRVIKNKFPIVEDHEVIIHSPDHNKDIGDLPHDQVVRIIRAIHNRLHYFCNRDQEVFIFNNSGSTAGATISHPHSQIISLRGFPGIIESEKSWALRYFNEKTTCAWCDELEEVVLDRGRVVLETPHFIAFIPKACRWSYEVRLTPKVHRPNFGFIDETEINDFAQVLQKIVQAYCRAFNRPDRNFWVHTQRYDPYHWHMGFLPHLKVFGAMELGAGIWVSDKATPEDAAKLLALYLD